MSKMEANHHLLKKQALDVLRLNDRATHTIPSEGMYPHAWLWDSAFISIGLRHVDPRRAATELDTIFEAQWANGMLPNMRFSPGKLDKYLWHSKRNPHAPRHIATSGITQPPVMAEAVQMVGQQLDRDDRRDFTARSLGRLVNYHEWIYRERNPNGSGLFAAVHPWETGMENTPTWMQHMQSLDWGVSGKVLGGLTRAFQFLRSDHSHVAADQRADVNESVLFLQSMMKLRGARYDHQRLAASGYPLHFEDVAINSILIRGNEVLRELANEAGHTLPDELLHNMQLTRINLEELYDENDKLYYPRDAVTGSLIKIPTVASLLPIYTGQLPPGRVQTLINHMENPESFGLPYGIPTVPRNSPYYRERSYWTGPSWVNTDWLAINGLLREGYSEQANRQSLRTLARVAKGGMYEYASPETAEGLGAKNFSWTAGLVLDLLHRQSELFDDRLPDAA